MDDRGYYGQPTRRGSWCARRFPRLRRTGSRPSAHHHGRPRNKHSSRSDENDQRGSLTSRAADQIVPHKWFGYPRAPTETIMTGRSRFVAAPSSTDAAAQAPSAILPATGRINGATDLAEDARHRYDVHAELGTCFANSAAAHPRFAAASLGTLIRSVPIMWSGAPSRHGRIAPMADRSMWADRNPRGHAEKIWLRAAWWREQRNQTGDLRQQRRAPLPPQPQGDREQVDAVLFPASASAVMKERV